ncbi:DEAD/DEAH box helicase [Cellulosilyticum sp. I15G10I2]|uniref:DEAD/DEAH box helicase n=1 Tax=Cellulosilyticum sp. I15G10I2 TaxID=1892843 RepID=UPI000A407B24|nr:DEAD/DEAH box helicase [Cellulosilyticum sp. I15G10I2]
MNQFKDYTLSTELLKAITMLNYKNPTQVQQAVIPTVLEDKDIVVKSQTGSGKSAAFAIPICEKIVWEENRPQALVLTPTRELAMQVGQDFFNIGRFKRLKTVTVYGKHSFTTEQKDLKQKTHVVVGTPGRVLDHIERGTLILDGISYLVIDEADEMLNMGFIEQVESIISALPKKRITMLFSATLPEDIEKLSKKYMQNPAYITIQRDEKISDKIEHTLYEVRQEAKPEALLDITIVENAESCIIFCNTKQAVDELFDRMTQLNYTCEKIHGGMEQEDRSKVMNDFKRGYFRYLIATDVAARGIDIENIELIINYDIPQNKESYVHRIGRTGRAGKEGKAITFLTPYEEKFLLEIENYIAFKIPRKELPDHEQVRSLRAAFEEKMTIRPKVKQDKGISLSEGIMKLHIASGKKSKMRPVDIVGTLSNLQGMSAEDIGIINVQDVSTFVEILNNKGDMVLKTLQTTPIKGRLRRVSRANQ